MPLLFPRVPYFTTLHSRRDRFAPRLLTQHKGRVYMQQ